MSVKLADFSKKVGLSLEELKEKLKELGFEVKPNARVIDEDLAQMVEEELTKKDGAGPEEADEDIEPAASSEPPTVKVYEEFFDEEADKEIIKSQRKMTAGKDVGKPKKTSSAQAVKPQPAVIEKTEDGTIIIPETITVKEFCEKTGLNPVKVIGELMKNGIRANINQTIDFDTAAILSASFNIEIKRKRTEATAEDISMGNLEMLIEEKDETDLVARPPIVTIMGHVDHGKTKLLDAIRETDVVSTEAGGITQHIGAYQVEKNGRKITFIDTPGHEAFTAMRARGAKVTDIVILVVAADEGVKPQTIEALNHAKEAEVPIIVALTKIDKEDINIDRVKAQLAEQGLQPEDWGGKTIMTPVSAISGDGIPALLEMILLTADLENLRANPNRPGVATVLEANLDKNMGPVATVVANTGTLKLQDSFVIGDMIGRVKTMRNHLGVRMESAGPATPVRIAGLPTVPKSGDILQVMPSFELARSRAEQIKELRKINHDGITGTGLQDIMSAIQSGKLKTLKVVMKADTQGSLEAIKLLLPDVKNEDVAIKIIHSGVGVITESDVMMAAASGGILIGFNTRPALHVPEMADRAHVQIFLYNIIYKMLDDLKKILSGMLEPEVKEVTLGQAEVRKVFLTEKSYMIVGCKVISGKVESKAQLRILRNGTQVGTGVIHTLKKNNDPVHELGEGNECGIKFEGDVTLEEKDILEAWKQERRERFVT